MRPCRVSGSVRSPPDQLAGSPGSLSSPDPQGTAWSLAASVPRLIFPSCLLHEHLLLTPPPHPQDPARGQRWGLTYACSWSQTGLGCRGWGGGDGGSLQNLCGLCFFSEVAGPSGDGESETKGSESCDKVRTPCDLGWDGLDGARTHSGIHGYRFFPDLALSLQEWAGGALNVAVWPEGLARHQ